MLIILSSCFNHPLPLNSDNYFYFFTRNRTLSLLRRLRGLKLMLRALEIDYIMQADKV